MRPYLALQYPDESLGRGIIVATTRDHDLLRKFKSAVLEEARRRCDSPQDEIVALMDRIEVERLERVFSILVPDSGNGAHD